MTPNEISHYESLIKQYTANRKLIKKLQLDKQALKEQLILSGVVGRSEHLKGFVRWRNIKNSNWLRKIDEKDVDQYLKSL
jgi:hypothetical protein